jgi:hypothetical protein
LPKASSGSTSRTRFTLSPKLGLPKLQPLSTFTRYSPQPTEYIAEEDARLALRFYGELET